MFYVLLWVGLVAVSLAIGPVWRVVSPVRTVYRLLPLSRQAAADGVSRRLGYWPAAFGLFAFVWLELASPDPGSLAAVKIWLLRLPGGDVRGRAGRSARAGTRSADPFEVYGVVASRLSPLRRNPDGRIAIGNPFDHLPSMPVRPGTVAVLAVLLGSTAFDSFSAMPQWRNFVDATPARCRSAPSLIRTRRPAGLRRGGRRSRSGWRPAPPAASTRDAVASCRG